MLVTLIDRIGEWNPQLFRELKGRLKPTHIVTTVFISLVVQFILGLFSFQNPVHQWERLLLFRCLDWIVPLFLLIGGVYLLIEDLAKEEHRGTLNFIRLSPQSSENILLGKLLGVPALVYLASISAIPLHFVSALASGVSIGWLIGIYTLWGAVCGLFYSAALLIPLLYGSRVDSKSLSGMGVLFAFVLGLPCISLVDFSFDLYKSSVGIGNWQWFWVPLGHIPILAYGWTLIVFSVAIYWLWQALIRRFHNPNATLVSKKQSYWLVASFQIWLVGFFLPEFNSSNSDSNSIIMGLCFLFVINPIWFLIVSGSLSPGRQALQDWARYRRERVSERKGFWNRSLVQDLIWSEKSPTVVAMAINLLIAAAIWMPWILMLPQNEWNFKTPQALLGLLLTMNAILIYICIADIWLFLKPQQRKLSAVGMLVTTCFVLILFPMLSIAPKAARILWFFSIFPVIAVPQATATTLLFGLLGQWLTIACLGIQLRRRLKSAGESATKALFSERPALPISD